MSGVTKIAARTPEDLGSTKIDATAVVNEKSQVTAPQYNRLADYVIELQAAVGTAVDPAPGSITQRIDAVSDPNKIYDDAGTTRVETEEETGHVTTTADGHRVIDAGRYETTIETDTSDVLGEGTLAASKLHLLNHEDGLGMRLGVEASAEFPGEDPVEFFSGVSSKIEGASLGTWGGALVGRQRRRRPSSLGTARQCLSTQSQGKTHMIRQRSRGCQFGTTWGRAISPPG